MAEDTDTTDSPLATMLQRDGAEAFDFLVRAAGLDGAKKSIANLLAAGDLPEDDGHEDTDRLLALACAEALRERSNPGALARVKFSVKDALRSQVEVADLTDFLRRALTTLVPRQRVALILRRIECREADSAAYIMGMSEDEVEGHLRKALEAMRKIMAKYR
jgi:DNA-directed RNA polymerase specialized sigma24 family protein